MRGRTAVDSDDEVEVARIREEEDSDIEVEDGDSRLSTKSPSDEEMEYEPDSRNPRSTLNRSQPRQKPSVKVDKGKPSKKSRRTVISDGDDEDYDSMPWRSDTADGDPPFSPPHMRSVRAQKGKSRADFEAMDMLEEDRPVTIGTKRPRPVDPETVMGSKLPSPPTGLDVVVTAEPLPKKKLPPIKKIKLSDSSASSPMPTSKATPTQTRVEKPKFTVDNTGLPPPPSSLPRKPAATAGNADLDLSNADVYKQLFSTGNAPPKSGLKEKEERMRELHRMRDEARAKRQREAVASFNLAAQHDKIEAFTSRLEARRSPALWPNTLAAKFKANMQEKMRSEQKARQQQPQPQHIPPTDRKANWTTV